MSTEQKKTEAATGAGGPPRQVVIEQRQTLRPGIPMRFSGQEEDENYDPLSNWVDVELVVPPLSLDSMQLLEKKLHDMGTGNTIDALNTLVEALYHALNRNYRNVPKWLIRQSIDIGNLEDLSKALMDLNGMHRKEFEAKKAMAAAGNGSPPTGT